MTDQFVRFSGGTFDRSARTVEAVIATPAPYPRRDSKGPFLEVLDTSAIDPAALAGLPLLDNHRTGSVRDVIGRIETAWREGDKIVARLQFGTAPDVDPILDRVEDGTLRGCSIGYSVTRWEEPKGTTPRTKIAAEWRITEATLTAFPADPSATIRSQKETTMDEQLPPPADHKTRRAEVRDMVRTAGLPAELADELIDAEADDTAVRARLFTELMQRPRRTAPPSIQSHAPAGDDPATLRRNMADALAYRMGHAELPEAAKPFAAMTARELMADSLQRQGISTRGMSTDELIRTGMHTTSDFPAALQDATQKILLEGERAAPSQLKRVAHKRNLRDFREAKGVWVGDLGKLEKIEEGGEITSTTFTEGGESWKLSTYARLINLSRELIVNDDLGAFGNIPAAFGRSAVRTETDLLVETLTTGGKLADGLTVFDASRGNTRSGALDVTTLTAVRLSMRTRKSRDGSSFIDAAPKYLVVPASLETDAEVLLSSINAATIGDVNPFSGKLKIIVEPRLPDTHFYVFADPAVAPSLAYSYLSGAEGVQVQRREMWDQLGISFRAWLDFGSGWIDWRGVERVEIA